MIGTGTTLSIGTQTWADNLVDLQWIGIKRKAIETTAMGTSALSSNATQFGSETWVPASLTDPGYLKFRVQLNPDNLPKVDMAAQTFFVVYPNQTMWTGSGFVVEYENNDTAEAVMFASYAVKISGNVTVYSGLVPVINDVSVNVVNDSGTLVYGA